MAKKYFILDIKGGRHNIFGNIAIIYANPVQEQIIGSRTMVSTIDHYCADTEMFIIPEDPILLNPIISEAQCNNGIWLVELSDFRDHVTFNENLNRRIVAHLFKTF